MNNMQIIAHSRTMLMAVLILFVVRGASAQECFEYGNDGHTVITGLTAFGKNATELTIPASVKTVKAGAFDGGKVQTLTINGGNPLFESSVLSAVNSSLASIDVGSGMSAGNIKTMLNSLGNRDALETVVIGGFSDDETPTIKWDDLTNELTSAVHVILPATLVNDQVFGDAKLYGRFTINGELATTCVNASFVDVDDGSNFLFYIPTSVEDGNRIKIQRVKYIAGRKGVMIHNTTGTAVNADLLLDDGATSTRRTQDDETYTKNMFVGVTESTTIGATDGDKTNLILYQGAFHPTDGGTIPANRAYLQIPTDDWTASGAKQLVFNFDDIEAAIDVVTEDTDKRESMTNLYDLAGRRVSVPVNALKGVFIRNGRKVLIK